MTYKEKIKDIDPFSLNEMSAGGVLGCPGDYFSGAPLSYDNCPLDEVVTPFKCTMCWNRLYKGEKVYD